MSNAVSYANETNAIFGSAALEAPTPREAAKDGEEEQSSISLFGEDGFDFFDLLDIINPLQHIPLVSTLYRRLTGDELGAAPRVLGGALFGGPIGAATSLVNAIVEGQTGKDIGEHAVAWLTDETEPGLVEVAQQPPEAAFVTAARATAEPAPAPTAYTDGLLYTESSAALMPPPVTREALPPLVSPAPSAPAARRAAPDLGALGAIRRPAAGTAPAAGAATVPEAAVGEQANAMPAIPAPTRNGVETAAASLAEARHQADVFAAVDYRDRLEAARRQQAEATVAARPLGAVAKEGGWFSEVMISALDKYEAGADLARTTPTPRVNILN